jgi:hypothetical protein
MHDETVLKQLMDFQQSRNISTLDTRSRNARSIELIVGPGYRECL